VGGGTILKADKVVVTQPSKGEFKAFSAVCTHQGCLVAKVEGGQIVCPCHGSHFSITDGSPKSGPAQSPLQAKKVSDQGGTLTVT
jgi:Rieske Fe-S protein